MKTPRTLIPPARRPGEGPPAPLGLYVEPEEDLLILGEMLHDVNTMGEMLRQLPFERNNYRGTIRVVLGAAVRMGDRCRRLLGEAIKIDATAQNIFKDEAQYSLPDAAHPGRADASHPGFPAVDSQSDRKNGAEVPSETGTDRPKKTGHTPVETFIIGAIADAGAMTTSELLRQMVLKHSIASADTNDALAKLRTAGKVHTSRLGSGYINRIAS